MLNAIARCDEGTILFMTLLMNTPCRPIETDATIIAATIKNLELVTNESAVNKVMKRYINMIFCQPIRSRNLG